MFKEIITPIGIAASILLACLVNGWFILGIFAAVLMPKD